MGIFRAVANSFSSSAEDQWKEFFYCDSIPADTLMVRGIKHTSEKSANHGSDDVITDGSIIALSDGQCAIIVSNGKVIDVFTEPGENVFDSGVSPSIFGGSSLKKLGGDLMRRISFAGDFPGVVQRVYYLNTKEIPGIPFGNDVQIPFRIRDERGLDIDCSLVVAGKYSFRICDPGKIYRQLIGNVDHSYKVSYLASHMSAEVNSVIQSAIGSLPDRVTRPFQLSNLVTEVRDRTKDAINEELGELRGIEILSLAFDTFRLTEKDSGIIRTFQNNLAIGGSPEAAAGTLISARAEAMTLAAQNTGGAGALALGVLPVNGEGGAVPARDSGMAERGVPCMGAPDQEQEVNSRRKGGLSCMGAPDKEQEADGQRKGGLPCVGAPDRIIGQTPGKASPETQGKMNFCPECGSKLKGGKYCTVCGYKFR
ncbi:MAG: SPFH domain-containing protein [Lachnospiraceae bacterium]|nr:SPFH domain-containing protein [Lachnospiraceae bacterium]